MPDRRTTLALGAAFALQTALPGRAAAQDRPNAMPEALRRDLERDPNAPVIGNPDGDITLTEFFDYNCQFCRKMVGVIRQLTEAEPGLRVVMREWPLFGENSEFAARAALASVQQGRYWDFHTALMTTRGPAEEASVIRAARDLGLDLDRLRADMEADAVTAEIERAFALADHMQLAGTPSFIAGDEAAFGEYSLVDMRGLIARARATLGG